MPAATRLLCCRTAWSCMDIASDRSCADQGSSKRRTAPTSVRQADAITRAQIPLLSVTPHKTSSRGLPRRVLAATAASGSWCIHGADESLADAEFPLRGRAPLTVDPPEPIAGTRLARAHLQQQLRSG
jgi:hypothetical protein